MIRLPDRVLDPYPQRGRDELSTAWAHPVAAATHGARQLTEASRHRGVLARDRAVAAGLALRGELPVPRWRWVGVGLAAGVLIGAVGAAVLTRRRHTTEQTVPEQTVPEQTATVRKRASTAVGEVKDQASAAVHRAASAVQGVAAAARDTVDKVREKVGDGAGDGPEPKATSGSQGPSS